MAVCRLTTVSSFVFLFLMVGTALGTAASPVDVLIVRDGHTLQNNDFLEPDRFLSSYTDTLTQINETVPYHITYDVHDVPPDQSGPNATVMGRHDLVIWYTLNDFPDHPGCPVDGGCTIFYEPDIDAIETYLDNNGRMLLSGHRIAWESQDRYESMLKTYFGGRYRFPSSNDDIYTFFLGKNDDKIANNDTFVNINTSIEPAQVTDFGILENADGGSEAAEWAYNCGFFGFGCKYGKYDSITYQRENDFKTVFFGFGFEAADKDVDNDQSFLRGLVNRSITMMAGPSTTSLNITPDVTNTTVTFDAVCQDIETNGNGIADAGYAINPSKGQRRDPRDTPGENSMNFSDGSSGNRIEDINATYDPGPDFDDQIDGSDFLGVNITVAAHCKDDNKGSDGDGDGYWGQFDTETFRYDTVSPNEPTDGRIEQGDNVTNRSIVNITLDFSGSVTGARPTEIQLTCTDKSGPWGPWRDYSRSNDIQYYSFDSTNTGLACPPTDGKRGILVRTRDEAGNILPDRRIGADTIWLDTTLPSFSSINPSNNSVIKPINLTINGTDSLSQPAALVDKRQSLTFLSTGRHVTYTLNESFDPQWATAGETRIKAEIRDLANNSITKRFHYTIDPFSPRITASPSNNSYITSETDITLTVTENISSSNVSYYNNGTGTNRSFSSGTQFDPGWGDSQEGSQTLSLWVNDTAGNVNATGYTYLVDNSPPRITNATPSNTSAIHPTDRIRFDIVDEAGAGIDTVLYSINNEDNTTYTPNSSQSFSWPEDGTHNLTIWMNDTLGHTNKSTYQYIIDSQQPSIDTITPQQEYLNGSASLNISTSDPSPSSGITDRIYNNGSGNYSFTDNSLFNPGWSTDGLRTIDVWVIDAAGNSQYQQESYTIDTKPPAIDLLNPTNASYLNATGTITPSIEDQGPPGLDPAGIDTIVYSNSTTNTTITNDESFNPLLTQEGTTTVTFWVNDTVGNTAPRYRSYVLDTEPPVVTETAYANNSFITSADDLWFILDDDGAGIDTLRYNAGTGNTTFSQQEPFNPGWSTETTHTIRIWKNDTVQNINKTGFQYKIDDTPPNTTANDTDRGWRKTNASIKLSCDDAPAGYSNSCATQDIRYCIHGQGKICQPKTSGNELTVGCADGSLCNKTVKFRSRDKAGNVGVVNSTNIRIDRTPPSITVSSPSNNSLIGGNVSFKIDVTDNGAGIDFANYTVRNRSDSSQVFKESSITQEATPTAWWDSTSYERVNITLFIESNDSLDQKREKTLVYTADNLRPALTISQPANKFHKDDIPLELNATRDGENLKNSTYFVYNQSSVIKHGNATGISETSHGFIDTVDASAILDGNYTLNFTAFDSQDKRTTTTTWVVLDQDPPTTVLSGITNDSWQKDSVTFSTTDSDLYLDNNTCKYRYQDDGAWSANFSRSCSTAFSFETTLCNDDASPDCIVETHVQDTAGNINRSQLAIKVDNSAPDAIITGPEDGTWQNGDFSFTFNRSDPQGLADCSYRVNSSQGDSGWIQPTDCTETQSAELIDVENYCNINGTDVCQVTVNASNNPGTESRDTSMYSIDTETPQITIERYKNNSNITKSDNFLISTSDQYAGINTSLFNNTNGNQTLPSGRSFDPDIEREQRHTLTFWLIDEAGNTFRQQNSYAIDNYPPQFQTIRPTNNSNISGTDTITITYGDNFTGINKTSYNIGNGFRNSFTNNTEFEPSWETTGTKTIDFRIKDFASNQNNTSYRYFLDTEKPVITNVSETNDTVIKPTNITVDVYDPGLQIATTRFRHDDLTDYTTFPPNTSFNPRWTTEGPTTFNLNITDTVGNSRLATYRYTIDNSTPTISTVTRNTSSIKKGTQAKIVVDADDQYAGVKTVTISLINQTSNQTTQTIPLTKQNNSYVGTYTGTADTNTNLTINVSATDSLGFKTFDTTKWLLIDNKAPQKNNASVNISPDRFYSDIRILNNNSITFTANLTDNANISKGNATIEKPDGTKSNKTLKLSAGNRKTGNWTIDIRNTSQKGVYNISTLWIEDTTGNSARIPMTSLHTQFRTVRPKILLNSSTNVNAATVQRVNITVDYNHSFTGSSSIFLPPNDKGSLKSPYLENTTKITCDACSLSTVGENASVQRINTTTGSTENITLTSTYSSYSPKTDTNITTVEYTDTLRTTDNLTVRAPQPTITDIFCDQGPCIIDQNTTVTVAVQVNNTRDDKHTGAIENYSLDINYTDETTTVSNSSTLESGATENTSLQLTIEQAGNTSISTVLTVPGGNYSASSNDTVHVRDTKKPTVSEFTLFNNSDRVGINKTAYMRFAAEDNIGVDNANITVQQPTKSGPISTNIRATLDTGDYEDGVFVASFNNTTQEGQYNITQLTATDTYTNTIQTNTSLSFDAVERQLNASVDKGIINASDAITLSANYTGNTSNIEEVEANITKPGNKSEIDVLTLTDQDNGFIYSKTYRNASKSGNYTATIEATTTDTIEDETSFTVPFSTATIESVDNATPLTLPTSETVNLTFLIRPENGDMLNTNTTYTTGHSLTGMDAVYRDTGNITFEEGAITETWTVSTGSSTATTTYFDLKINATNPAENTSSNITVSYIDDDTTAPSISSFTSTYDTININQPLHFYATITDNTVITETKLQISNSSTQTNVSMGYVGKNNLTGTYTPSSKGMYNATVFAKDIGGNWASSPILQFNATDIFTLKPQTDNSLYQKGDTVDITLNVSDINNKSVEDFNASVNLSKAGKEISLLSDNHTATTNYTLKRNDPPTGSENNQATYTVKANVSKYGNTIYETESFSVSQILNISFVEPSNGEYIEPGTSFNVTLKIEDVQGNPTLASSYTTCSVCERSYTFLQQEQRGRYVQTKAFVSPDVENFFTLSGYAFDQNGNSHPVNPDGTSASQITISTEQESSSGNTQGQSGGGGSGGGGSGGGGGRPQRERLTINRNAPDATLPASATEATLNLSTSLPTTCTYNPSGGSETTFRSTGNRTHLTTIPVTAGTTYSISVTCQGSNQQESTQIVFTVESKETASYELSLPESIGRVEQGTEGSTSFSILNNGSSPLEIRITSSAACCETSITRNGQQQNDFVIGPGNEPRFSLTANTPLYLQPGEHDVSLRFQTNETFREQQIQLTTIESTYTVRVRALNRTAHELAERISQYAAAGLDISTLESDYQKLTQAIQDARNAIRRDNLFELRESLDRGENAQQRLQSQITAKEWEAYVRQNWWKWALFTIFTYMLIYLLGVVLLPYLRIQTELTYHNDTLEKATKARKKAEKQYFKRQIDRKTFMNIMTSRQDEILEERGKIEDLKEEKESVIYERLSANSFLKTPVVAIREINRFIQAQRTGDQTDDEEDFSDGNKLRDKRWPQ